MATSTSSPVALSLACALAACGAASVTSSTCRGAAGDEFIVSLEMGNEVADPAAADWRLDQAVAVGARWVRIYIPWALVEQEQGVLTWKGSAPSYLPPLAFDLDYEMAGLRARGLRAIAIMQYTPSWARSGGDVYTPPADPQTYAAFVRQVVMRYGDVVRIVEVWNEVDVDDGTVPPGAPPGTSFWHGTVAQYVAMLNGAYDAVKATDPSVVVLSSGLAALTPTLLSQWLDVFFSNQPRPELDWFGWHPYGLVAGAGPDAEDGTTSSFRGFDAIAARLDREGYAGAPILLSEFGYRYDASPVGRAEDTVASMLPEAFAVARSSPRVRGLSWFSVKYHGGDGDFGLYTDAGEQRISFVAFRTFLALTTGWRFETRERGTDDGSAPEVYRFASASGRRLWMVYAPFMPPDYTAIEPQPIALQLAPGETATLVERDGARRQVTADGAGRLVVEATSQPTYVVEP